MPAILETSAIHTPLTVDNSKFLRGLDQSLKGVRGFADKASAAMKRAGQTLTLGVTTPILGAAVAAVKLGTDLDREMRNIQSVSKGTEAEITALSDTFVTMSTDLTKTTDSAVGLAAGFYDIQGSGFAGADAMMVLEASTKAASAGLTTTDVASAAVTASLNAYGEGAGAAMRYSDLLFRTVDVGVGTFEGLSNSIGYVVGTAAQAGVGFDEISAALATASKQGIDFDKGARALNMLILALIDPSTEMADALKNIGFESGQAALDSLGLAGTLQSLEQAGYGGTEGMASLGLSSMALRGALALTGEGAGMFAGDLAAMQSASEGAGATQEAFAIQTQSVAMQMDSAKNKLMALALGFSDLLLPPLLNVLGVAGQWLDKLLAMDDHTQKVIVAVAAFAAALGPVLLVTGKLITTATTVGSALSGLVPAIELVIVKLGLMTGAATMAQAALMVLVPVALIAGLALLIEHIRDVNQQFAVAEQDARQAARSYEEYKEQAIAAAEETGKLSQANVVFAHGMENATRSIIMSREEWVAQQGAMEAAAEGTKRGLVVMTEGLIDYTRQMEGAGGATEGFSLAIEEGASIGRELWSLLTGSVVASTFRMVASTEEGAVSMSNALADMYAHWGGFSDQVSFWGQTYENGVGKVVDATEKAKDEMEKALKDLGGIAEEAYRAMTGSAEKYASDIAKIQEQSGSKSQEQLLSNLIQQQQSLEQHRLQQAEMVAQYQAEAAALAAAGQTEQLADLTRSHEKALAESGYSYAKQLAQQDQAEAIRLHMAQVANAQQLYDAAKAHYDELVELQKHIGNKMMLWVAMHRTEIEQAGESADALLQTLSNQFGSSLSLADQFDINWTQAMKDWTAHTITAGEAVAMAVEGVGAALKEDLDKATSDTAAAKAKLDDIGTGWKPPAFEPPAMPDWSQWTQDYSGGVSGAGSQIKESATKVLKEVTEDIATAFEKAMSVFEKVAGYKPAKGLGAAMEALRKDIQEAVHQLYIAYDAIGKDGVEGAGLIAEAASKVFDSIGTAVDTFGKLADYTPPLRSAMDSVLEDVKYVLVKVRTELLDLWGWAGERKDTVWGHMMDWADAVKGVVELVGLAATTFTEVDKYTGIMPGVADRLAADIKQVLDAIVAAIGGGGGLDEAKVQWVKFASDLLSLVAGMIDDLETVASYGGGIEYLSVSGDKIVNLVSEMGRIAGLIGYALYWDRDRYSEAAEATRQAEADWLDLNAGLIAGLAAVIEDTATLAGYEGGIERLSISGDRIVDLVSEMGRVAGLIGYALYWDRDSYGDTAEANRQMEASWLDLNAGLISSVAGVIEDMEKIAGFEGGLAVSEANVTNLMEALITAGELILESVGDVADKFDEGVIKVEYTMQAAWLKLNASLVSAMAGIVDDIEGLAGFEGVDQAAFGISLTNLFDALYWFLDEFSQRASLFAGVVSEEGAAIAELMGRTASGLGDAVKPVMDVAAFSISPAEAEVAIGKFFDALAVFLTTFKAKAADFQTQVDQDTASLATIIGDTVSGIGSAVEPLINILEYNPEVVDVDVKFAEFFGHLERVLWWIEFEKGNWVVSDAAAELAAKVDEVMGHLKTAVDFLDEMGIYGEDQTTSALTGFLAFLIDLEQVVGAINTARDRITEEALSAAEEFAEGCSTMLDHITDGINTLNSLPNLALDFYQSGYALGVGFIQGMIDGLVNNASTLFQTIMDIVAAAIAAANAAAGAASPSKRMWELGDNMVAGLRGALEAGQADIGRAIAGLVAVQGGMPAFAMAGAGAGLGGAAGDATYNQQQTSYHYHEAPGIGANTRASLRQDFEAMELYDRVRGR